MTSHDAGDVTSFQTSIVSQEGVVLQTGSDLAVTAQGTPDMTVAVAKGSCYVLRDAHVEADNSVKFWKIVVTAATNVTIPSADASNPRIDLICVKIDTGASPDATASNVATLVNVEGTAAASPSAPSVPTNHLKLAEVSVPALDTTISSGQITDYRTYTGLVVPYSSGYRLTDTAGNLEGQLHEDSDGKVIMRSSRSGGQVKVDPTDDSVRIKGREDEVNEVAMAGSVAGGRPAIQPKGTDTNIDLLLKAKGTGRVRKRTALIMQVVDPATDMATGNGKFMFTIPKELDGMNLVDTHAGVYTAGTTGTADIQIRNITKAQDMLSTVITIDSTEEGSDTAATPAVIDTAKDDVSEHDRIAIDVDSVHTTEAKGLTIRLEFELP